MNTNPFLESSLRRRDFLRSVGLAVGSLGLSPLPLFAAVSSRPKNIPGSLPAIGLLLPSVLQAQVAGNISAGLQLYSDRVGSGKRRDGARITLEKFSSGHDAAVRARSLIEHHHVDLLISVMNPNTALHLQEVLATHRTPLIVADAGANSVRHEERSPYIFYNTLGYWRASWAMGAWTVRNLGKRVFVASSFYESGYDALYAFQCGMEKAGGEVVRTYVSHIPPDRENLGRLIDAIRERRPDVVFAQYSGREAREFIRAFADSGLQIPLVCSSFMLDETLLSELGTTAAGIKSCQPWAAGVRNQENEMFMSAFRERTGRRADAFAVLGYETGQLIHEAMRGANGDIRHADLRSMTCSSPRGMLVMDSRNQSTMAPLYVCEVRGSVSGFTNQIIDEIQANPESHQPVAALRSEIRTGWLNPYLCV